MKSILLHVYPDTGQETRLQFALDLARATNGHIVCLQITPVEQYIREDVSWDWQHCTDDVAHALIKHSPFVDALVLSQEISVGKASANPLRITGAVANHARAPVFVVPQKQAAFDPTGAALIAWNGSSEVAHAIRLALPLLSLATKVHIVEVTDAASRFPATDAAIYLARHDIIAEAHERPRKGRGASKELLHAGHELAATYIVMGAYGHARLRETILGGVTRELLLTSDLPLLMAH
jgi:nucleotide-binding universal stress UspA family protein